MSSRTKNQDKAFEKFRELKVGALFMKMGSGKTRVAIDLVNYNQVDYCLYVTPYATKDNIVAELKRWKIDCPCDVVGYETIQSSSLVFLELLEKLKGKRNFIIADESIFIKNEKTKRFGRLLLLRNECEYALLLNGTPLTNNEWDLYNQMYFLSPKIIGMNREQFLNTFFTQINYKRKGEREHTFYKFSEINAEALNELISPYTFECDLVFDKNENEQTFEMWCDKSAYVEEKGRKLSEYLSKGDSETIINMLTKLSVIASNAKEKNDRVCEYIKGKRVIVYCNFISEVEYIASKVDCYVITGGTKHRRAIVEQFKNDNKPLLMTFGVGAFSLNMQFCNEIVYSSLNFDFGKIEQSKYRIKRIGQSNDIAYTYFLGDFGINKLILENLKRKQTLESLVKEKFKEGKEWVKYV